MSKVKGNYQGVRQMRFSSRGGGRGSCHGSSGNRSRGRNVWRRSRYIPIGDFLESWEKEEMTAISKKLKVQARSLKNQLKAINDRISEIESFKRASPPTRTSSKDMLLNCKVDKKVAAVNKERCCDCGTCIDFCPEYAITLNDAIEIDIEKCTACGACVNACPNGAMSLTEIEGAPYRKYDTIK